MFELFVAHELFVLRPLFCLLTCIGLQRTRLWLPWYDSGMASGRLSALLEILYFIGKPQDVIFYNIILGLEKTTNSQDTQLLTVFIYVYIYIYIYPVCQYQAYLSLPAPTMPRFVPACASIGQSLWMLPVSPSPLLSSDDHQTLLACQVLKLAMKSTRARSDVIWTWEAWGDY